VLSTGTAEAAPRPTPVPDAKPRGPRTGKASGPEDGGEATAGSASGAGNPEGFSVLLQAAGSAPHAGSPLPAGVPAGLVEGLAPGTRNGSPSTPVLPSGGKMLPLLPHAAAAGAAPASAPQDGAAAGVGTSLLAGEAGSSKDAGFGDWSRLQTVLSGTATDSSTASPRGGQGTLNVDFLSMAQQAPVERGRPGADAAFSAQQAFDGRQRFEDGIGQRLMWMTNHGVHDARVRVHPEHLGPIDIHVRMNGDSTHVSFSSPHAPVREALADAVPRLREMLGDAGLSLGHADVDAGGHEAGDSGSRSIPELPDTATSDLPAEDGAERSRQAATPLRQGLVDTFA